VAKAFVLWTALMFLWGAVLYAGETSGEYIALLGPMMVWIVGSVLLTVVAMSRGAQRSPGRRGPRTVCTSCGNELYGKWWNEAKGGYECRQCGVTTPGRVDNVAPSP
jgi:hypothetical protein